MLKIVSDNFELIFSSMCETLTFHMDSSQKSVFSVFSRMSLLNEPFILFKANINCSGKCGLNT